MDIAGAYEADMRFAKAEMFYRRSFEAYRAVDHMYGEGDVLIRLGHLQANRGKYSQAILSLERANELKEKMGQVEEIAKVEHELACIYRRLNRLEDARSAIEKTIDIVENQRVAISADLVVLSSCESALGKDLESEGIIGLPRGFLYAGAKSVIASLWKVDDEATAKLMSNLYARIQRGESLGSALRGAQLDMLHDEQWAKPYYWAAFVLEGEYR
jgi:tetratricopeptide (TPR) repeat protein